MTMGTEDHICSSAARMKGRKDMGHYSIPVGSIPVGNNYSDYKLIHSEHPHSHDAVECAVDRVFWLGIPVVR
jgi:hypothetical protein